MDDKKPPTSQTVPYPIPSMYGIFNYMKTIKKSTIHVGKKYYQSHGMVWVTKIHDQFFCDFKKPMGPGTGVRCCYRVRMGRDGGRDGILELPRVPLVGKAFESKLVLGSRSELGGI